MQSLACIPPASLAACRDDWAPAGAVEAPASGDQLGATLGALPGAAAQSWASAAAAGRDDSASDCGDTVVREPSSRPEDRARPTFVAWRKAQPQDDGPAELAARLTHGMREEVRATRDSKLAASNLGLRHAWQRLSAVERLEAVHGMLHLADEDNAQRASIVRQYVGFCTRLAVAPYPRRKETISIFLADRCFVKGCKSHGLLGTLSHLRCHGRRVGSGPPLPYHDDVFLHDVVRSICKSMPSTSVIGRSLSHAELLQTVDCMRRGPRSGSTQGRQALALLLGLVMFQSRGNELLDGGTRIEDLTFHEGGVARKEYLSKTHKDSLDGFPKVALCMPAGEGLEALCFRTAILAHLEADSKRWRADPSTCTGPLFCALRQTWAGDGSWTCSSLPLTAGDAMELLRSFFVEAGVPDPEGINVHFGRATGTNTYLVWAGLQHDSQLVGATGGWAAPPTDTMHKHYLTLTPAELVAVGRKALIDARFRCGGKPTRFCCDGLLAAPWRRPGMR